MSTAQPANPSTQKANHLPLLIGLFSVIPLMFAFAFVVMPPLYDAFCDWTGLNGKVSLTPQALPTDSTSSTTGSTGTPQSATGTVKVQLVTHNNPSIDWDFNPNVRSLMVTPGQSYKTEFIVRNPSNEKVIAQAIPSISPPESAQYVKKMECFCFNKQPLEALESKSMPMTFYLAEDTPDTINTITISYTLYDITDKSPAEEA